MQKKRHSQAKCTWNKVVFESVVPACAAGGRLCAVQFWSNGSNLNQGSKKTGSSLKVCLATCSFS